MFDNNGATWRLFTSGGSDAVSDVCASGRNVAPIGRSTRDGGPLLCTSSLFLSLLLVAIYITIDGTYCIKTAPTVAPRIALLNIH